MTGPMSDLAHPHGLSALDVIVVDGREGQRRALCAAVGAAGPRVRSTSSGFECLRMHQQRPAGVIVCGGGTAPLEALDLCRRLRSTDMGTYTYVLVTRARTSKRDLVEAVRAGADDCLTEPVDADELEARLIAAARVVGACRKLSERNIDLRHDSQVASRAARTDALTGLWNRLRLDEDLDVLQADVSRYGRHLSFAMCDLDQFKRYNDHYGHPAGDDVLRQIGRAIAANLRRADRVYRYGGEEFLVSLPEQKGGDAAAAMERVRCVIETLGIRHAPDAHHSVVTVSVGLAPVALATDRSVTLAVARADRALYVAKARGGNSVATDGEEPDARRASA